MLLNFEVLRRTKHPRRVAIAVAVANLALVGVLGLSLVVISLVGTSWRPDYSHLVGAAIVVGALVVLGVVGAHFQPRLIMRSTRRLTDDPHNLEAYFASLLIDATLMSLLAPSFGFIGALIFQDYKFFLGAVLLGMLPVIMWWPSARRWSAWEARLRGRGIMTPAQVSNPAAWHLDPMKRHELRFWDGASWTPQVIDGDHRGYDPLDGQSSAGG